LKKFLKVAVTSLNSVHLIIKRQSFIDLIVGNEIKLVKKNNM